MKPLLVEYCIGLCSLMFCVPLLLFVTTKAVASGEELLATYGHAYWTQSTVQAGGAVDAAFAKAAREADLWQVSIEKKHSLVITTLDEFIVKVGLAER